MHHRAATAAWHAVLCLNLAHKFMRLLPSDPDTETIIARIESGDLNLQPEFQRGEVWSKAKKQRLVDSILRDWHVPPIHVIELKDSKKQEVLDGQQRLVAIRDFYRGDFAVDGSTEPFDSKITQLGGLKYRELPPDARRQFNQFTIRIFRIVDYKGTEPAELFFRLNQPTNLTAAEQRNAFFGPVREQIKSLVMYLDTLSLDKSFLGFSNSRMAYDDVLSRAALCIERNSISEKIASSDLIELYRSEQPLKSSTEVAIKSALDLFAIANNEQQSRPVFNKATIFSWLIFVVRAQATSIGSNYEPNWLGGFLNYFSTQHNLAKVGMRQKNDATTELDVDWLLDVYEDRSTSRVADVASVILRDLAIWFVFSEYSIRLRKPWASYLPPPPLKDLGLRSQQDDLEEENIVKAIISRHWGVVA